MRRLYSHFGDRIFALFLLLLALGVVALALLMAYELYQGGSLALNRFGFWASPREESGTPWCRRPSGLGPTSWAPSS